MNACSSRIKAHRERIPPPARGLLAALLLLPASGCGGEDAAPGRAGAKPYNVILVSIDTLRADRLSGFGYPLETTPNLDRFAGRSVVFTNAHSQSSWTTPSHASLFTSLYPSVLNLGRWPNPGVISPEAYTLAESLRDHGYATAGFLEAGLVSSKWGFSQGFQPYRQGFKHIHESVPECLNWIDRRGDGRFFAFLHTYDVHRYEPPEGFDGRFIGKYSGKLEKGRPLREIIQKLKNQDFLATLTEADRKRIGSLYDEALLYVDHWMGVFFQGLEERGLLENTIVILVSDHGEEFFDHGHTGHGYTSYQEMLHVPLIVHHPDIPPGRREGLVSLIDVAPTVAEMVGAPERPDWQGDSFFALLRGEEGKHYRFSFAEKGHKSHEGFIERKSVRDDRWKLIRYIPAEKDGTLGVENRLYDLENDPRELSDVSASHPKVLERLSKVLDAWLKMNALRCKGYQAGETALDPETLRQLEDLGYTGGGK